MDKRQECGRCIRGFANLELQLKLNGTEHHTATAVETQYPAGLTSESPLSLRACNIFQIVGIQAKLVSLCQGSGTLVSP